MTLRIDSVLFSVICADSVLLLCTTLYAILKTIDRRKPPHPYAHMKQYTIRGTQHDDRFLVLKAFTGESRPMGGFIPAETLVPAGENGRMNPPLGGMAPPAEPYTNQY